MAGRESDDHANKYVHSFLPLQDRVFFWLLFPFLLSETSTNSIFEQCSFFFFKVFHNSGFTRTLCGGKWESLPGVSSAFNNTGSSTVRSGCCLHGTFMAQPNADPFTQATACASCPVGNYSGMSDDLNCPYTATTCPGTHAYAVEPASCRVPIPDCTYAAYANPGCTEASCYNARTCGIRQAVDAYIAGSTEMYGPIEDWNTSLVTDMSSVFESKSGFNANISAWQVGKVTTMLGSTYTLFSPPTSLFLLSLLCLH